MSQPLFLDESEVLEFSKEAAEVTLPEDPSRWTTELLQELYKQAPFVADFEPDVVMDRVDGEKAYGFGHVELSNKTEIQGPPESPMMQSAGIKHVRIPIIIREGKLQPLDILITDESKMLPLTESRVRQALFRPNMFDVTSRTPGDQSMISQLYPPYRQNYGFGGGGAVMTAGMGKEGSIQKHALFGLSEHEKLQKAWMEEHNKYADHMNSLIDAAGGHMDIDTHDKHTAEYNKKHGTHFPSLKEASTKEGSFSKQALFGFGGPEEKRARSFKPTVKHFASLGLNESDAKDMMADWPRMERVMTNSDINSFHHVWKEKGLSHGLPSSKKKTSAVKEKCVKCGSMEKCSCGMKMAGAPPIKPNAVERLIERAQPYGKAMGAVGGTAGAAYLAHHAYKKHKEKKASVLEAILPTISPSDFDRVAGEISSLKLAFYKNAAATRPAIEVLQKYEPKSVEDGYKKLASAVKPTVAQIVRTDDGYVLKTASHMLWAPQERLLDRGEVVRLVGAETALTVDKCGSVTMADPGVEKEDPEEDTADLVKDFGIYKVQDDKGRHLIGFCFPNLIDVTGEAMPLTLFTNGGVSALQGEIAGVKVSDGASLMSGRPRGYGVFYETLPNGKVQATVPLNIHMNVDAPEAMGSGMVAETIDGRQVKLVVQPGVSKLTMTPDGTVIIPDDFSWMPLEKSDPVVLVDHPDMFSKTAAMSSIGEVTIRHGGNNTFSVSGWPVEKVAYEQKNFLDIDDTMFLLGAVGVSPQLSIQKMGEAYQWMQPVSVKVAHVIEHEDDVRSAARAEARGLVEKVASLRKSLVKEAAAIPDPTAVDTVLSLGFLNPENLMTFISHLPQLNETQGHLCELLVAARLGQREIPTSALERAIRALEETIEGLNVIAFQKN